MNNNNNNNNNNKTKFILNYQTPFLHYLLSFLMIIIAISFITFAYYLFQHKQNILENDIKIQVLSPLNTFIDRNFESPYVKNSYRVVVRHWLTKG